MRILSFPKFVYGDRHYAATVFQSSMRILSFPKNVERICGGAGGQVSILNEDS